MRWAGCLRQHASFVLRRYSGTSYDVFVSPSRFWDISKNWLIESRSSSSLDCAIHVRNLIWSSSGFFAVRNWVLTISSNRPGWTSIELIVRVSIKVLDLLKKIVRVVFSWDGMRFSCLAALTKCRGRQSGTNPPSPLFLMARPSLYSPQQDQLGETRSATPDYGVLPKLLTKLFCSF